VKEGKTQTFSFTEESNALDFLEEARRFIERTATDPAAWKWVAISLHGALYGFSVAACRGTTNDRVVKVNRSGREQLVTIGDALRLCQDPAVMGTLAIGKALVITDAQKDSVKALTQIFRNRFEHHIPGDWTFFVDDFPPMCRDVLEVIRLLVRDTGHVLLWRNGQSDKFDQLVSECQGFLK
jgi:hypothetical protein